MTESEKIAEKIVMKYQGQYSLPAATAEIAAALEATYEQARAEALEEAAKLCDANAHIHHSHGESTWGALAESQAIEIRALKPGGKP